VRALAGAGNRRALEQHGRGASADAVGADGKQLDVFVDAANRYTERVEHPREAVLATADFRMLADVHAARVGREGANAALGLVDVDLATVVARVLEARPEGAWARIGRMAIKYTRTVPCGEFMRGVLDLRAKTRALPVRGEKRAFEDETQPDQLAHASAEDTERTNARKRLEALHEHVARVAPEGSPQSLFDVLCNRDSFGQTAENLLDASSLVQSGRLGIEVVDGRAVVSARQPPTEEHPQRRFVLSFSVAEYLAMAAAVPAPGTGVALAARCQPAV